MATFFERVLKCVVVQLDKHPRSNETPSVKNPQNIIKIALKKSFTDKLTTIFEFALCERLQSRTTSPVSHTHMFVCYETVHLEKKLYAVRGVGVVGWDTGTRRTQQGGILGAVKLRVLAPQMILWPQHAQVW